MSEADRTEEISVNPPLQLTIKHCLKNREDGTHTNT